jgi:glycosyltransferase involved in cell wall biosynthesis
MRLLFIQSRPSRAGAQTSLARILESEAFRQSAPRVLLGEQGWLSEHLDKIGVSCSIERFPAARSLYWRIRGLSSWASKIRAVLSSEPPPQAIVANNHHECPLARALSQAYAGIPVLGILRSSGMTQRDFVKHQCGGCRKLLAVGNDLQKRASQWSREEVGLFAEGFLEAEFVTGRLWPTQCPRRLLVIGSEMPLKGFTDFIDALRLMEMRNPDFEGWDCHFTGTSSEPISLAIRRPFRSRFEFLGRICDFPTRVQTYEFAVHPSRSETFGLAPMESLIAGTPTLVSETGVAGEMSMPLEWRFPPGNVEVLSHKLEGLWKNWPVLNLTELQTKIRTRFHINKTAHQLRTHVAGLLEKPL